MTSGQSGPHGDPDQQGQGGPPQGWNAPPSQPPYGQQQPGQPPYGQQYPGYAPAPSAPTGYGAPPPMERPTTVRAGIGALVASLVLGLISAIVTFSDLDGLIEETLRQSTDPAITEDLARTGILIGVVITLIILGLQALFIWFAWQGRNWARIVIWVLGGISVVFGLVGLAAGTGGQATSGFATSLGWFQLILTAVGIVALALKPSNDWYRFRGWQRANGQG
ncbi:hypothetical protein [Blastococcus tunisiensis]|uniref:Uncharacterized protein n=1 Tax=Blastococcus tunisiensis TaxID=1798228 RepID=A0A1I2JQV0_9ACTN|nr:hypothetical protein [Blastococcus sp. DSM 46838]SFF56498.1 hypothetical protein SAMN05216574_11739 [Blastococcus sp. DSM 46838]